MENFFVETKGKCFLCLDIISIKSEACGSLPVTSSTTAYSFQYLSRYLRMNRKKVFNESGSIPLPLLAKVERSSLKVELCKECAVLTEGASKLCQQLEKIELEVMSKVKLIQGKLLIAEETGRTQQFLDGGFGREITSLGGFDGKCQVVEKLRKETLHRCSKKLHAASPRVKLQNLTTNQLHELRRKLKFNSNGNLFQQVGNYTKKWGSSSSHSNTQVALTSLEIKLEGSPAYAEEKDYISNQISDAKEEEASPSSEPSSSPVSHDVKMDNEQECNIYHLKVDDLSTHLCAVHPESGNSHKKPEEDLNPRKKTKLTDNCSTSIPAPVKVAGTAGKWHSTIDPATGKHACGSCSNQFSTQGAVKIHYENVHLKIRYKCTLCGDKFTRIDGYRHHFKNIHLDVRFKCHSCNKTFRYKSSLFTHQRIAHLQRHLKCKFCPKTFTQAYNRNLHMKKYHLNYGD